MKKLIFLLLGVYVVCSAWAQHNDRYVVVLSLDAFRYDLADNANTPTLDSLKKAGAFSETFPCFPANTFPNHYAMATGLHPDNHGIVGNNFYDSKLKRKYSMGNKPDAYDPIYWQGEPIWNTVERQGLKSSIFMWVGCEITEKAREASVWRPYDGDIPYTDRADWVLNELNKPKGDIPNLIMWYIEEPDATAHHYSPESPETIAKVEQLDSVLHYFFVRVKSSPVFDKINFIVTADHGMAALSKDRYINLYNVLDTDKIEYCISGSPTLLEPKADYLEEAYAIVSKLPHMQAFKRDEIPAKYHYGSNKERIPELVILPETGWVLDYRPQDKPKSGGAHGFDPYDRQMHTIFYASGPQFKKSYIQPSFQNLNLYILISKLLGVEPAPNDGDIDSVKGMLK